MGKKHNSFPSSVSSRDESSVFLDEILQWLCDLQSRELEIFDKARLIWLGEFVTKKTGVKVFCDLDRNYRNAYSFRVLMDEQGNSPSTSKDNDYYTVLKLSRFEVRVDISQKGGFFILQVYAVSSIDTANVCIPVQERSKPLVKFCKQLVDLLKAQGLIQIPDLLVERHINGQNELGGEVTVKTQLFGEV